MDDLFWLFYRVKRYTPLLILALLGSILESLSTAGITLIVKGLVDGAFVGKDLWNLHRAVGLFILFVFLSQVGAFAFIMLINLYAVREKQRTRWEIFRKLVDASPESLLKSRSGDFITRIISDLELYGRLLGQDIPKIMREPFVVVALFGVLLYRDVLLTLLLLFLLPVMSFAIRYFGVKKGKHTQKMQEEVSNITQDVSQALKGYENIKIYGAESRFLEWFAKANQKAYKANLKVEFYSALNSSFNYVLGYMVIALIIVYGGMRVINGSMTTGEFLSYITALSLIQMPIINLQKGIMEIRAHAPVLSRIREILNLKSEEDGREDFRLDSCIDVVNLRVKIEEEYLLMDVNLRIRKGEKLGIMGHTGSGKSTLLRVLCGLLPYEGEVLYDGVELRQIRKASLRENITLLTQEPFLFLGTVRENLSIAKDNAKDEELWEALRLASCDFVSSLDQMIEEGGKNLSGGERQRLALARVFLKDPQVLLLDEATSALDAKTEKEVLDNLLRVFKDRTIVMVAHRFSNIRLCDRAILVEKASVVKEGSPEEVIQEFLQRA